MVGHGVAGTTAVKVCSFHTLTLWPVREGLDKPEEKEENDPR